MLRNKEELMIQISYRCNLNCIHCAYGDIKDSPSLSIETVKNFLKRHNPKIIKISGGEPTLHPLFGEVVKVCKETNAKVVSFTNGLQTPKVNPDFYWVSLYGSEQIHNWITKAKTWHKTMNFIKTHNVEYLNSPVFSWVQMASLLEISEKLDIPLRITQLLPHGQAKQLKVLPLKEQQKIVKELGLNKPPHWVTCSLGFEPPRCNKKACLKPDGTETICTYIIRGLKCPFSKELLKNES